MKIKLKNNLRILRWCIVIMCAFCVRGQAADCTEDFHCYEKGYYCNATYRCVPCITCADHGRQNPNPVVTCVKSLSECGECKAGYSSEDSSQKCDDITREQDAGLGPASVIAISVISVLVVIACVVVGVILYRRRGTLCKKILYDLDPPPPYNMSSCTRVASVPAPERDHAWGLPSAPRCDDDIEAAPMTKDKDFDYSRAKEDDQRQNVHLVNPPNYVRLPPGHDMGEIESSFLQPNGITTDNAINNNQINGYIVTTPDNEASEVDQRQRVPNNNNVVVPANTSSDVVLGLTSEIRFETPDEEIPFIGRDSANRAQNQNTDGSTTHQIVINNNYYNYIK